MQNIEFVTIKNSTSSNDIPSSLLVWHVALILEVVSMLLGNKKTTVPIFTSTLLPPNFHWNQPRCFPSRSGRRFCRQT